MAFRHRFGIVSLVLASALLGGCATTATQQKAEWDGLVRQPHPRMAAVFVRPGIQEDMPAFNSVMLDPIDVSFSSEFENNRRAGIRTRRLDADDLAAIQQDVAGLFQQVFREELQAGGYQVVDKPGPETLRVSAAIVDLFITAPEATQSVGRSRTYVADSGRMTLVRAADARSGRSVGTLSIANRATNRADASRAMRIWARALREGLDEFHARKGTQ